MMDLNSLVRIRISLFNLRDSGPSSTSGTAQRAIRLEGSVHTLMEIWTSLRELSITQANISLYTLEQMDSSLSSVVNSQILLYVSEVHHMS